MPLRLSNKCLGAVKALPGGTGEGVWGAWGWFAVFKGVSGCWKVYGGLRGVSGRPFPSFAFNSRKSQIRFVTFSSRPGGPRCLKYQNVPELRPF